MNNQLDDDALFSHLLAHLLASAAAIVAESGELIPVPPLEKPLSHDHPRARAELAASALDRAANACKLAEAAPEPSPTLMGFAEEETTEAAMRLVDALVAISNAREDANGQAEAEVALHILTNALASALMAGGVVAALATTLGRLGD